MRVLVACEFSGVVRRAFRAAGHEAWSCDLLPALDDSEYHIQGDVRDHLDVDWDLMIAHPPCTYLCNSGVRWLHEKEGRFELMKEAAEFFRGLVGAPIPRIAVENPVMHKYAVEIVGRRQDQIVQPWWFGDGYTKATGLWLKDLPPLVPTNIVDGRSNRIHMAPDSKDRWKKRSLTPPGFASAAAQQWSEL